MRGIRNGFTLVELIVVMAVFILVIMITSDAFKTVLTQMGKITKSEESNIEGMVGLEMFRHDLQQVGYGLPYSFQTTIKYPEAASAPASTYNDGTGGVDSKVPRAIVVGNNLAATPGPTGDIASTILAGTDYLALKGSTLATGETAQRWTYVQNNGGVISAKTWESGNLAEAPTRDRVIVLKRTFNGSNYVNQMVFSNSDIYWALYYKDGFAEAAFNPPNDREIYYVYGIRSDKDLRMPFNRTDYFVARPTSGGNMPSSCAPQTGVLYKATVNHDDGRLTYIPMLDCVADMQVVLGWDLVDGMGNEGQDGVVETYSTSIGSSGSLTVAGEASQAMVTTALGDPELLRKSLKIVKIYLLAQVGKREASYQSPASYVLGDAATDLFTSKTYDFTAVNPAMRNYHWKVYRIVVRPKNLQANQ